MNTEPQTSGYRRVTTKLNQSSDTDTTKDVHYRYESIKGVLYLIVLDLVSVVMLWKDQIVTFLCLTFIIIT